MTKKSSRRPMSVTPRSSLHSAASADFERRGGRLALGGAEQIGVAGRGQRGAIHLAARREGERVERHDGARDHRVGQLLGEEVAEQLPVQARVRLRHDPGVEPRVAGRGVADGGDRLAHRGVLRQRRLHLAQLDAHAAQLDLMVDAAQVLEGAVGAPARPVSGPIEPGAGLRVPRVGHEALGGEVGPVEVAAGQADAAEMELAGHAGRHGLLPLVEHPRAGPAMGRPMGTLDSPRRQRHHVASMVASVGP